jgi:adhesin transport system outer membrane protein
MAGWSRSGDSEISEILHPVWISNGARAACLGLALMGGITPALAQAELRPSMGPPVPLADPSDAPGIVDGGGAAGGASIPPPDMPAPASGFNAELADLIESAVQRHPSIASQQAALRAAGVDVTAAWLTRLPTMSIQMNQYGAIALSRQVTANVDLPLWTNGRIGASIDRARAGREVQVYRLAETVLDLELQVNQTYHDAKRLGEHEAVLAQTLEVMGGMVASMERRVRQEVSPLADLELANSRRLQIEQQLNLARAQRASALARLRALVLRDDLALTPGFVAPAGWPRWDLAGVTDRMLATNPERLRVEAEARVTRDDARIAAAARFPGLFGSYSYDEIYKHRVGISVRMQTAGGFSEIFSARAAKLREQASDLQAPVVELNVKATASTDLVEYDSALARNPGARDLASASQKITESYVRQFVSGRRTWLDVMNAVREATTAQLDAIDVEYTASAAAMRILLRTGEVRIKREAKSKEPHK